MIKKLIMLAWIPSSWKTTFANKLQLLIDNSKVISTDIVYNNIWKHFWYAEWEFPNPKYWNDIDKDELHAAKFSWYSALLENESWTVILEWLWMSVREDRDIVERLIVENNFKTDIILIHKGVDYFKWIKQKWVDDSRERFQEYRNLISVEEIPKSTIKF